MKFSILIPVYNVERYLEQCLESVINQTFGDYEVIIVDDGSTDNSSYICDSFAEKYPEKIYVIHKENQGLISARRIAIDKAQGEFCIFVDSDDFIECNLEQASFSEIKFNKGIEFSQCNIVDAEFMDTNLKGVDVSSSKIEGIRVSPVNVKGMIVNEVQAIDLIYLLGIVIK